MSDRPMVKGNKYFETEQWKLLSSELKRKEWKTARSSKEAKIVRDMKKEFMEKVKAAENLASKEKDQKKAKEDREMLQTPGASEASWRSN